MAYLRPKPYQLLFVATALIITPIGCSFSTPPAHYDPFEKLPSATKGPSAKVAYKNVTLGLVLTDNTKNTLKYLQDSVRERNMRAAGELDGLAEEPFEDVIDVFRKNFKSVTKIGKIEDAKDVNIDLVGMLDIYGKFSEAAHPKVDLSVKTVFVTPSAEQIDMIQGVGNASPYMGAQGSVPIRTFKRAMREAIKNLEVSLNNATKAVEFSKGKARTPTLAKNPDAEVSVNSDVDKVPFTRPSPKKHSYAVVIGIERYREQLPQAAYAERDAKLMGEYLTKVLGFPEQNIVMRLNERATRTDLAKFFEEWLHNNVEPDSSVFIYYSGHGAPSTKSGEAYLVPYDGDPSFIETTGYPIKQLYAALDKLPAQEMVVVIDSCFSGAGGRSVLAKGAKPVGLSAESTVAGTGKAIVLAASSGNQISTSYDEQGHGLLTYFFLKGLQGYGDLNKDGVIDMTELYEYLKPNVQKIARKQYNIEQTPQLLTNQPALRKGIIRHIENPLSGTSE